jgi:hypothetical protein
MEIIGRKYRDDHDQEYVLSLPDDTLRLSMWWWGNSLAGAYPDVDTWMCMCETYSPNAFERARKVAIAEIAFTDGTMAKGKPTCVFNCASGAFPMLGETDPDRLKEMETFAPIIKPLLEHPGVKYLGLHAYGNQASGKMNTDDAAFYALRYRAFVAGLRKYGVNVPPVVITEDGEIDGWTVIPEFGSEGLKTDLQWFGDRLLEDDYVVGSTYYLDGTIDPDQWGRFDIRNTDVPEYIAEWNRLHPVPEQAQIGENPMEGITDPAILLMADMWKRQKVTVNPDDGFFKFAVGEFKKGRVIVPQQSPDGNFTTDVGNKRIAYMVGASLWCVIGEWQVQEGFPF